MQLATTPTDRPLTEAHRRPSGLDLAAAFLLLATVVLHVVAMFPTYFAGPDGGGSLASQADQAALYSVLAASWALAIAIGLAGPARTQVSAGLAVGIALTELGFRVADLGTVFRYGTATAGTGLWLMDAAWVVGAAGAAVAWLAARSRHGGSTEAEPLAADDPYAAQERTSWTLLVAVLAVLVAGAFLPSWDHYYEVSTVTGRSVSRDLGNAFSAPWQVVIGTVMAGIALALVPMAAVRFHRRVVGAALACGSLLVLAGQLVSAIVQIDQPVSPAIVGVSPSQATQLGLHIGLKLTGWFTLDAVAAYALFAAVMVWATLRVVQPATRSNPPDWRGDPISWEP